MSNPTNIMAERTLDHGTKALVVQRKTLNRNNLSLPLPTNTIVLPETTSATVTNAVTGSHKWDIVGYSMNKGIGVGNFRSSGTFHVGGHDWVLRYFPDGDKADSAGYVSIYLALLRPSKEARARFDINVLYQSGKPMTTYRMAEVRPFGTTESAQNWGYSFFVECSKLEASQCLKDDCFSVRCNISVVQATLVREDRRDKLTVPPPTLFHDLRRMLESQVGADVTFEVGGDTFTAHRFVLAMRSPVFLAQIFGPMMMKDGNTIKIDDMEPAVFKVMLHFMYTDSLPEVEELADEDGSMNAMMAQHLLVAADHYGLERLKLLCQEKLFEKLDVSNAATTMALAEQHNCQQLRKACVKFIESPKNLLPVMETDGYDHLEDSCAISREILKNIAHELFDN